MRQLATIAEVIAALEDERAYQDLKWNADTTASGGFHSPTEWLVYIEDYVREAKQFTSRNAEPQATEFVINALRKIGAMAVAAQQQNGVRARFQEGGRPVGFSAA